MLARISLAAFISVGALTVGCSQSHPPVQASAEQIPERHYEPRVVPAQTPAQAPASAGEPDDASLLARKTSDYARNVSPLLGQGAAPATRPSIVQWDEPTVKPQDGDELPHVSHRPMANQGATLAAIHFKQDSSVPQILPESADFSDDSHPSASATYAASATGAPGSTDEYEQKLQKLVRDYPQDLGYQFDYELLRLVRDEPTPDLASAAQLTPEDRDLLLALMDGLSNFRNAAKDEGNIMLNRKIQPLLEMSDRLRSQAQLSIPTVAFCTQVVSYGVYTPMASSRFPAGRNNDLIVYNEVANFTSIQGSDSIWRTRLQQEMVLYTDTGLAVWPEKSNSDTFVDQSRNRRHDFFISRLVRLPSSLAAGKYVLKVTLTDEESNRVVEASTPLEIVGDSGTPQAVPASDQTAPASPDVLSP